MLRAARPAGPWIVLPFALGSVKLDGEEVTLLLASEFVVCCVLFKRVLGSWDRGVLYTLSDDLSRLVEAAHASDIAIPPTNGDFLFAQFLLFSPYHLLPALVASPSLSYSLADRNLNDDAVKHFVTVDEELFLQLFS